MTIYCKRSIHYEMVDMLIAWRGFRKHMIIKGRYRDSAWLSILDDEWPAARKGFEAWLEESNFDENGKQKKGLSECRDESQY